MSRTCITLQLHQKLVFNLLAPIQRLHHILLSHCTGVSPQERSKSGEGDCTSRRFAPLSILQLQFFSQSQISVPRVLTTLNKVSIDMKIHPFSKVGSSLKNLYISWIWNVKSWRDWLDYEGLTNSANRSFPILNRKVLLVWTKITQILKHLW